MTTIKDPIHRAAMVMAAVAPDKQRPPAVSCVIPWEAMNLLREALEETGYDWRIAWQAIRAKDKEAPTNDR